ncbi:acyl-CoA dehydrogenase family protein [candidate division KSB1 bacterium]|nr:acyl-CoA dehydrogenase family protein [candidate division KSB1 bacterium]
MKNTGLDKDTLDLTLSAIKEFATGRLPDEKLIELDEKDEFPVDIVREMCTGLGIRLLFIPEEFSGMGGGAFDVYRLCEQMARIDLGIATGVLATFLGSDPIMFGRTPEQKKKWLTHIAEEGLLMAYGATDLCSILAKAPGGPSWFVVEKGTPGFSHGKPEDKHGIRASNTAPLSLDEVYVDADHLLGGVEGQGLIQA